MRLLLFVLAFLLARDVMADEFKPAYLQIKQTSPEEFDILWKVPALDERQVLSVRPVLPAGTRELTARRALFAPGATVFRWRAHVPGGLDNKQIRFDGLSLARVDVLVRLSRLDGTEQLERLNPAEPSFTAVAHPGAHEVIRSYTWLGVEHILLGIDHLLFVAALVMLVRGLRNLLVTITAFTVAHSITLALATLGVLDVPGPPVEATIALSIMFVAVEILRREQGFPSLASEKPALVAFAFGLLHGLGFAGALAEVGLPPTSIPLALLFFNVGVEAGQILFVSALLACSLAIVRLFGRVPERWSVQVPAYAIGGLASYWFIERALALGAG
jgi:hydrogenase/urease accessory protein HupE